MVAQWLGQFSGHTHATKVADVEASMRRASAAFLAATSEAERLKKGKALRALAKRLMTARLKFLKARIVAAQTMATAEAQSKRVAELSSLRVAEAGVHEDGVEGILREYGVAEAAAASAPTRRS
jgi:hypothetical protein